MTERILSCFMATLMIFCSVCYECVLDEAATVQHLVETIYYLVRARKEAF